MKNLLFTLALFMFCTTAFQAQEDKGYLQNIFRVDFLAPGFGGEVRLSEKATLEAAANLGYGMAYVVEDDEGGDNSGYFMIAPEVHTQLRFYFNQERRLEKSKSILNNSGLFAGLHFGYYGPEIYSSEDILTSNHAFEVGPVFGVQRTFNKNVQLGFSCGLGFQWSDIHGPCLGAPGSLNFSYVILPKRNKVVLD